MTTNLGLRQIKGCVALAPVTLHCDNIPAKYRGQHKSYEENANAWMVDEESMKIFMGKLPSPALFQNPISRNAPSNRVQH